MVLHSWSNSNIFLAGNTKRGSILGRGPREQQNFLGDKWHYIHRHIPGLVTRPPSVRERVAIWLHTERKRPRGGGESTPFSVYLENLYHIYIVCLGTEKDLSVARHQHIHNRLFWRRERFGAGFVGTRKKTFLFFDI